MSMRLENEETGEIRELWYKRVDENTEDEVESRGFKKFFNEHYRSLKGRKHANDMLDSSLITAHRIWYPPFWKNILLCTEGLRSMALGKLQWWF